MSNAQRTIKVDGQDMVIKHKFEDAGLGLAPFRLIGIEKKVFVACHGAPVQPGSSCDYCGTAIMYEFWIADSTGKRFKVGCDCVAKTDDMKLISAVKAAETKRKSELRKAGEAVRIADAMERVNEPSVREALTGLSHPLTWKAAQGATRLEWAEWMLQNSGNRGRMEVARFLDKLEIGAVDADAERKAARERIEFMHAVQQEERNDREARRAETRKAVVAANAWVVDALKEARQTPFVESVIADLSSGNILASDMTERCKAIIGQVINRRKFETIVNRINEECVL